ncbi:MAG: hypothetical protein II828_08775 [Clostridia bacterium]|nr:hypothetical protein [Clostridia bacterium]
MTDKEKLEQLQNLVIRECINADIRAKAALKARNSDEWLRFSEAFGVLFDIINEIHDFEFTDKWIEARKQMEA